MIGVTSGLDTVLTPRLRLVRPTWADFDDLFRMHTDPRVMATLGPMVSEAAGRDRMAVHLQQWEDHGCGYWIARDLETNAFLGRGGMRHIKLEGRDETEIGYGFIPEAWGRGLATELAQETIRVAFEQVGLSELVCFTMPTNRASRRVMEKVGFIFERDGEWAGLPHVFFRLTAERWQSLRERDMIEMSPSQERP